MKKIKVVFMCLCMLVGLTGISALAVDSDEIAQIQQMIDALPSISQITDANRAQVIAQLDEIDERKLALDDDECEQLDFYKYKAAAFALSAPDGIVPFAVRKTYVDSTYTPDPTFTFVDRNGQAAEIWLDANDGMVCTSLDVCGNGPTVHGYVKAGTYTLSEDVDGNWDMSMYVNGTQINGHTFEFQAGNAYDILAVNSYTPDYTIAIEGTSQLEFADLVVGYSENKREVKTITIQNRGTAPVDVKIPTSEVFSIYEVTDSGAIQAKAAGDTVNIGVYSEKQFTIMPKLRLAVNDYSETIIFTTAQETSAQIFAKVSVKKPTESRIVVKKLEEIPLRLMGRYTSLDALKEAMADFILTEDSTYSDDVLYCDVIRQWKVYDTWMDEQELKMSPDAETVTLDIDYPEGTSANTHDFTADQILMNDNELGTMKSLTVVKDESSLKLTMDSLSPIAIFNKEVVEETQETESESDTKTEETDQKETESKETDKKPSETKETKKETESKKTDGPATGDHTHLTFLIALLFVSGGVLLGVGVYFMKHRF